MLGRESGNAGCAPDSRVTAIESREVIHVLTILLIIIVILLLTGGFGYSRRGRRL